MARARYKVTGQAWQPSFLTCGTVSRLRLFSDSEMTRIVTESLTYLSVAECLSIHAYVVILDHLHLIASAENLSLQMNRFKAHTARQILQTCRRRAHSEILKGMELSKRPHMVDRAFQVWEEGFHPKLIISRKMLRQKMDYIHLNPVRHGLVERPEDWPCSSYPDYVVGPERNGRVPISFI